MDKEENFPIMLIAQSPPNWPIHLTLSSTDRLPDEQAYDTTYGIAKNYYHLADSQIYMGPNISFKYISIPYDKELSKQECTNKTLSFYVIVYTEAVSMVLVTRYTQHSPNRLKLSGLE